MIYHNIFNSFKLIANQTDNLHLEDHNSNENSNEDELLTQNDLFHHKNSKKPLLTHTNKQPKHTITKTKDYSHITIPLMSSSLAYEGQLETSGNPIISKNLDIYIDRNGHAKVQDFDNIINTQLWIYYYLTQDSNTVGIFNEYNIRHDIKKPYNEDFAKEPIQIKDYNSIDKIFDNFLNMKRTFIFNNDPIKQSQYNHEIEYKPELQDCINGEYKDKFIESILQYNKIHGPLSCVYNILDKKHNSKFERNVMLLERLPFVCLYLFEIIQIYSIMITLEDKLVPDSAALSTIKYQDIINMFRIIFLIPVFINQCGSIYDNKNIETQDHIRNIRNKCMEIIWSNIKHKDSTMENFGLIFGMNNNFILNIDEIHNNTKQPKHSGSHDALNEYTNEIKWPPIIGYCRKMYNVFNQLYENYNKMKDSKNPVVFEDNGQDIIWKDSEELNLISIIQENKQQFDFVYKDNNQQETPANLNNVNPETFLKYFIKNDIVLNNKKFESDMKEMFKKDTEKIGGDANNLLKQFNNDMQQNTTNDNNKSIKGLASAFVALAALGGYTIGGTKTSDSSQLPNNDNKDLNNQSINNTNNDSNQQNNPLIKTDSISINTLDDTIKQNNTDDNPLIP